MKRVALFLGCLAALVILTVACAPKPLTPVQPPIPPPPMTEEERAAQQPPIPTPPVPTPPESQPAVPVSAGLKPIYFDFDRFDIRPSEVKTLGDNAAFIKANSGNFTLEGYCDPIGTEEYNRGLGLRRANSVKAQLVSMGIDAGRLSVLSFGKDKLVTTDPKEFQLDRRVEFKVTK